MKKITIHSSPLYTYNSNTHTFSFNHNCKKENTRIKSWIAAGILVIVVLVILYILLYRNHTTYRLSLSDIPEYTGTPFVEINSNVPFFNEEEKDSKEFENYSELDSLGRCG